MTTCKGSVPRSVLDDSHPVYSLLPITATQRNGRRVRAVNAREFHHALEIDSLVLRWLSDTLQEFRFGWEEYWPARNRKGDPDRSWNCWMTPRLALLAGIGAMSPAGWRLRFHLLKMVQAEPDLAQCLCLSEDESDVFERWLRLARRETSDLHEIVVRVLEASGDFPGYEQFISKWPLRRFVGEPILLRIYNPDAVPSTPPIEDVEDAHAKFAKLYGELTFGELDAAGKWLCQYPA